MRLLKFLVIAVIVGFFTVLAVVVGATAYFGSRGAEHIAQGEADVIIVLSAGVDRTGVELDPFSRARVRTGAELWRKGAARYLLMSGGVDARTGQHVSEEMKLYAIRLGVPESFILVEGNSISTFENARFTLGVARQESWGKAIIVTDDFHLLRAWTLFEYWRQGDDIEIVGLAASRGRKEAGVLRGTWSLLRETLAMPFNVLKMTAQTTLEAIGMGEAGSIR